MANDKIEATQQFAFEQILKNNQEQKKSQRLLTILEKIAETTNSKDSRSKSSKSLNESDP